MLTSIPIPIRFERRASLALIALINPELFLTYTLGFSSLRSEEHTSELQSRGHLVCRLLREKHKKRAFSRRLDRRAVGDRTGERHPQLDQVGLAPLLFLMLRRAPRCTLFPYTTLCR